MPLRLSFQFGPPCAGDGHFGVRTTLTPGGSFDLDFTKADLRESVTLEEREALVRLLLKAMVRQLSGSSVAEIKAAIEAKTIDLTVTG